MADDGVDEGSRAQRIETLLRQIAEVPDPGVRARTEELIQSLLDLFGDGLVRMLELTEQSPAGAELVASFAQDDLIGSLLLLYGLHPDDIETRAARAIDKISGYVERQGGHVELIAVSDGVANVRLSVSGCSPAAETLQTIVEGALFDAAPDLERVEVGDGSAPRLITLSRRRKTPAGV